MLRDVNEHQLLGIHLKFFLTTIKEGKPPIKHGVSQNAKHQWGIWKELYFLCKISIVVWQTMGALGDCKAVRMNRESAGCVRVSAWGLCPKAPFSACHNKLAQGLVFAGSPAIFYYSTLHKKKKTLINQRWPEAPFETREGEREKEREEQREKKLEQTFPMQQQP